MVATNSVYKATPSICPIVHCTGALIFRRHGLPLHVQRRSRNIQGSPALNTFSLFPHNGPLLLTTGYFVLCQLRIYRGRDRTTRRRNLVEISQRLIIELITLVLMKTRCISREILIFINPYYRSHVAIHRHPHSHAVTSRGQARAATWKDYSVERELQAEARPRAIYDRNFPCSDLGTAGNIDIQF